MCGHERSSDPRRRRRQAVRRPGRDRRRRFPGAARDRLRAPRAERRRQDDGGADPLDDPAGRRRARGGPRTRRRTRRRRVRLSIGLAGQSAAVDPNLTGRENLRLIGLLAQLPRPVIAPRASELLERFDLNHAADRPLRTYSGGMRRRLDVAAALVPKPPVLFLDEPTTGLDLQSRNELWEMIRELVADGTTVLLTTQYLEEADRLAERVAVIDGGHVIANDTPKAMKAELGSTVVEMEFSDPERAERAAVLLARVPDAHPEREGSTVRISSEDGSRLLMEALGLLDAEHLAPAKLDVREPSLDDVFLALTGHKAATEPAADDAPQDGARSKR